MVSHKDYDIVQPYKSNNLFRNIPTDLCLCTNNVLIDAEGLYHDFCHSTTCSFVQKQ